MPENNNMDFDKFILNSNIRENLLNWYDFKPKAKILFIGDDIYNTLLRNDNEVIMLTLNKNNKLNDRVIVYEESLIAFEKRNEKVDYIIVVNEMKNISKYVEKKEKTFVELLKIANRLLNDDGVLLVNLMNKFSIKNFSGATYNNGQAYDVLLGKEKNGAIYSNNELNKIANNSDFKYHKVYFPFPDYKLPSIIYSSEYLPNENNSKLNYLIYFNPNDTIIFNEIELMHEIAKDGMLDYFSNSFFVEFSNCKESLSKIKFASYNNFRKEENKLITKMYDGYIQKEASSSKSLGQIRNIKDNIEILKKCNLGTCDKVENNMVISKYQTLSTFDEYIGNLVNEEEIDIVRVLIKKWYEKVYESSMCILCENSKRKVDIFEKYGIIVDDNLKRKMHYLTSCLFDLIFENVFVEVDDNNDFSKFIVYDQEWVEENAPVEFIIYRALKSLFQNNTKISRYIKIETLYEDVGISEFVSCFEEADSKIQKELLDEDIAKEYASTYSALTTIESLKSNIDAEKEKYQNLLKQVNETNVQWQVHVDNLELELKNYKEKLPIKRLKHLFKRK